MKLLKPSLLASSTLLLALTGTAFGEANMSFSGAKETPKNVNANVNFTINVPKILILRVGDWGDTVSNPIWNYAFGHSLTDGAATDKDWETLTKDKPEAQKANENGTLDVAVFSNTGGAVLSVSKVTEFEGGVDGYQKPTLAEISAKSIKNVTHDKFNGFTVGEKLELTAASGIVREEDKWTYAYTPEKTPAAGIYNASVTYTLASI